MALSNVATDGICGLSTWSNTQHSPKQRRVLDTCPRPSISSNDIFDVERRWVNAYLAAEITEYEKHRGTTGSHQSRRSTVTTNMNDLILAIIISASGYGAFLAIGIGCLIWYNIWNRKKMEREFETNEPFSARLEKPEALVESDTTSWEGSSVHHSTLGSLGPHSSMGALDRFFHARRQRHRASSLPSLSESAMNEIFQGRRRSTQTMSTLVEDANRNNTGLAAGGQQSTRAQRRASMDSRDSWEL